MTEAKLTKREKAQLYANHACRFMPESKAPEHLLLPVFTVVKSSIVDTDVNLNTNPFLLLHIQQSKQHGGRTRRYHSKHLGIFACYQGFDRN